MQENNDNGDNGDPISSCCGAIVGNELFQRTILVMIVVNCIS